MSMEEDDPDDSIQAVFHTEEEARLFAKEYVDGEEDTGLSTQVLIRKVRVEYSVKELDEEEAHEKERRRPCVLKSACQ